VNLVRGQKTEKGLDAGVVGKCQREVRVWRDELPQGEWLRIW